MPLTALKREQQRRRNEYWLEVGFKISTPLLLGCILFALIGIYSRLTIAPKGITRDAIHAEKDSEARKKLLMQIPLVDVDGVVDVNVWNRELDVNVLNRELGSVR